MPSSGRPLRQPERLPDLQRLSWLESEMVLVIYAASLMAEIWPLRALRELHRQRFTRVEIHTLEVRALLRKSQVEDGRPGEDGDRRGGVGYCCDGEFDCCVWCEARKIDSEGDGDRGQCWGRHVDFQ